MMKRASLRWVVIYVLIGTCVPIYVYTQLPHDAKWHHITTRVDYGRLERSIFA